MCVCVVRVCVVVSGLCLEGREWVKGGGGADIEMRLLLNMQAVCHH